jgi:hypothetical protein
MALLASSRCRSNSDQPRCSTLQAGIRVVQKALIPIHLDLLSLALQPHAATTHLRNLAASPTETCRQISSAKVPFAKAWWLAVLRRPVLGSVRWQANAQQPAAVAFATAGWRSKLAWPSSNASRPSPPMCFAIALRRATSQRFTGRCASGKISGNQGKAKFARKCQESKYMGRSTCSQRPLLRARA